MATYPVQITAATEYGEDAGFVIERYSPSHGWCIPAWEEMGLADLEGVFPTREKAQQALSDSFLL
jgi:hypothetical protein